MADENLNPVRDELRQAITGFMTAGNDQSIDRMVAVMDRLIKDARNEAKTEAKREADTFVPIPNVKIENDSDCYDVINQRIVQAKAIAELMGYSGNTELEDDALPNAAWAIRHLLDEADELAYRMRKNTDGFAAPNVKKP